MERKKGDGGLEERKGYGGLGYGRISRRIGILPIAKHL